MDKRKNYIKDIWTSLVGGHKEQMEKAQNQFFEKILKQV
jgi:muramidase (phage lysozyme)